MIDMGAYGMAREQERGGGWERKYEMVNKCLKINKNIEKVCKLAEKAPSLKS